MGDIINGRPGIGDVSAVGLTGAAQVGGHGQDGRGLQPVAIQAQERFLSAMQPAGGITERDGLARRQGIGEQRHFAGIIAHPDLVAGADVEGIIT